MREEYLWNREGEPDPDAVHLEQLLGQLGHAGSRPGEFVPRQKSGRFFWQLAAAAAFVGAAVALAFTMTRGPLTSWQLADGHRLRTGQFVGRASLESPATGHIDMEPGSRLRLTASRPNEERFDLERGTIHAFIWAPPGRFIVDTPSAKTTDLGCRYTLHVADDGSGLLSVETGWVAFERENVESFIPAGAACVTRPKLGPGTPWFTDAPEPLSKALEVFDTHGDAAALETILGAARERDGLTLWHLLVRTQGEQRAEVYDRFAALVRLPASVTRASVLRGDPAAIDGAWNALDLGSTNWWREWKRKW